MANAAKKGNVLEKLAQLVMVGAAPPLVPLMWRRWRGLRLGKSRDKISDQSEVFPHFGAVNFNTQTLVT